MRKLVALACLALAAPAFAQDAGDYAGDIAPGNPLQTPPGIYADTANRLAAFFVGAFDPAKARPIFAETLYARLQNGENLFLVDVRPATDYAKGHIAGAISIPADVLFRAENLAKLPTDGTPIVLVCHTGHVASMMLGGLAALGYNPYVLKFAMMGWNASSSQKIYSPDGAKAETIVGFGGPLVVP